MKLWNRIFNGFKSTIVHCAVLGGLFVIGETLINPDETMLLKSLISLLIITSFISGLLQKENIVK